MGNKHWTTRTNYRTNPRGGGGGIPVTTATVILPSPSSSSGGVGGSTASKGATVSGTGIGAGGGSGTGGLTVPTSGPGSVPNSPKSNGSSGSGSSSSSGSSMGAIIGGIAAAVVIIAVIAGFLFYRRRNRRSSLDKTQNRLDTKGRGQGAGRGGDNDPPLMEDGKIEEALIDEKDVTGEGARASGSTSAAATEEELGGLVTRIRGPQVSHADIDDLNIKTPLHEFEAQRNSWLTPPPPWEKGGDSGGIASGTGFGGGDGVAVQNLVSPGKNAGEKSHGPKDLDRSNLSGLPASKLNDIDDDGYSVTTTKIDDNSNTTSQSNSNNLVEFVTPDAANINTTTAFCADRDSVVKDPTVPSTTGGVSEERAALINAIAAMKAQYDEQYQLIHEDLAGTSSVP
ncbi:hypothetical protein KI688_003039 [Linnemannia hyalina]|uniref:Uncharacterized protein n=1 Tax=Linnemannia hyalina TaxID=64524 RepID=A0A9P8BQU4_9FUNG|nr:hypothetical protein KI688_003039 [Linnemannia hyalina]